MRHAKSDWGDPSQSDAERPLNARGHRAAARMATWIDDRGLAPDRILSSSANRTRQTVQHLADRLRTPTDAMSFRDDLYLADAQVWLDAVRAEPKSVDSLLICGHNPGFDDLVAWLSSNMPPLSASGKLMTTAAVAHFTIEAEWSDLAPGVVRLEELVRPRELGDDTA